MDGYFKYVAVYRSAILKDIKETLVLDPIRLEFFQGERTYSTSSQQTRVLPGDGKTIITEEKEVKLPDGKYIELIARTKEYVGDSKEFCKKEIDKVITLLSILYTSDLFSELVFQSWLWGDKGVSEAWVKKVDSVSINSTELNEQLTMIKETHLVDQENQERFSLMSKFYAKSLPYDPGEEKFLFLWTILEIFPMKGDRNIKPISEYVSKITRQSEVSIKEKLQIGRIFGIRSDLVHKGKFDVSLEDRGELILKTENLVCTVLREMVGLPYDGRLDKYLL